MRRQGLRAKMTSVGDIFTLKYGHSLEMNAQTVSSAADAINFVSRTARNNGVSARITPIPDLDPAPAGTVSVALGGQGGAGVAFLQPLPYYCGRDVMILTPKIPMAEREILWWVTCITANRFRFGFGRQANKTLGELRVPDEIPPWTATPNIDRYAGADGALDGGSPPSLDCDKWAEFRYHELFDIKKGQRVTKADMEVGDTPFIGAIDSNNGLRQRADLPANHHGNTITVNYNGSVAEAFYQSQPYWASDDVNVLYPKFEMSPLTGMFLCALIRLEKYRFNYGRKWRLGRMKESTIRLPTLPDGKPDWALMENYVRALPFSASIGAA